MTPKKRGPLNISMMGEQSPSTSWHQPSAQRHSGDLLSRMKAGPALSQLCQIH